MNAIILAVGDELLTGQCIDTNSAHLSRELAERGIATAAHWTVGDDRAAIAAALSAAAGQADLLLVTGGLGPTPDDLTRQGLADAMHVELRLNEDCLKEIEEFFRRRGRTMQPANAIQAMCPEGAEALPNRMGTAPGIAARLGGTRVYVMPGVPEEMVWMYRDVIAPRLGSQDGVILCRTVHTFGQGESDIAARIADLMTRGASPAVGTTVAAGLVTVRIVARGADRADAERQADAAAETIRRRLGEMVVGEGEETMASAVGELLRRHGRTLAVAESCTGGLVGQIITSSPGASEYFRGGVISYADPAKRDLLDVSEEVIRRCGAVSEEVARAMADGARRRFDSHWALGITGVAGPAGGSRDKPVGLVWIALAGPGGTECARHVFGGSRETVRLRAALTALNALRLRLLRA